MTESNFTNPHLYALIAGELSGDTLGAGLMKAILRHDPQAQFIGIGGPKMIKGGLVSSFNMDELSVMGIFEVVKHLRPILKIRSAITKQLQQARPCVMIGIDSPDFNLYVEAKLKATGIKTIHYVSPSVWAWREGRMKKIRAACDEVLALLPFEKDFYDRVNMPCTYVGHSLANSIPLEINQKAARERIALAKNCVDGLSSKVMAILPGSRKGIITRMLPIYARTARILKEQMPELTFIAVAPNRDKALLMKDLWLQYVPELSITIFVGNNQDVIASADVCLVTSGTVAFETMLLKRPMVVAYKVSAVSAAIARRLLKINMFSLPNLLAKREIVKELIQENCTPFKLSTECLRLLASDNLLIKKEFTAIHESIRTNSDELAAQVVMRWADVAAQESKAAVSSQVAQLVKGGTHSDVSEVTEQDTAGLDAAGAELTSREGLDDRSLGDNDKFEDQGDGTAYVNAANAADAAEATDAADTVQIKRTLNSPLQRKPKAGGRRNTKVEPDITAFHYDHDQQGYRSFVDQTQNADLKHDHLVDYSSMRTDVQDLAQSHNQDPKSSDQPKRSKRKPR